MPAKRKSPTPLQDLVAQIAAQVVKHMNTPCCVLNGVHAVDVKTGICSICKKKPKGQAVIASGRRKKRRH